MRVAKVSKSPFQFFVVLSFPLFIIARPDLETLSLEVYFKLGKQIHIANHSSYGHFLIFFISQRPIILYLFKQSKNNTFLTSMFTVALCFIGRCSNL